jgi:hypothetical protein
MNTCVRLLILLQCLLCEYMGCHLVNRAMCVLREVLMLIITGIVTEE